MRSSVWRRVARLSERLIGKPLLALFSWFRVGLYRVEGSSMEPTLTQGGHLIVHTFSHSRQYALRRGDVIVFECPHAHDHSLIKRLVGLGGEKVEVRRGQVYIDDRPLDEPYVAAAGAYDWGPGVVPRGQYFVLGDNRSSLSDSRAWGWLPEENIIGRVWRSYEPGSIKGDVKRKCFSLRRRAG